MDKLERYRGFLKQFLQERADLMNNHPIQGIDTLCLFDDARDEYLVYNIGWQKDKRVQYITLFARLHNGKIWIEEDGTEEGLANLLVEVGVPKEDIVLAFISPIMRSYSDYAAA